MSQVNRAPGTASRSIHRLVCVIAVLTGVAVAAGAIARVGAEREPPTDTAITNAVADRLLRDHGVEGHDIDVETVDGVVSLTGAADNLTALVADGEATITGTVGNHFDKASTESLAYGVTGVVEVNNDIEVVKQSDPFVHDPYMDDWYTYDYDWHRYRTETTKSDAAILHDIREELWWSPFVDSDAVSVSVSRGVATLTGSVDSIDERRAASENALEGGAVRVVNELRVEGAQRRDNS